MREKWREGVTRVGDMSFAIQYLTDNMPDTEAYNELDSHIFTDSEWFAFNVAIESLEKRIPQKPIREGDGCWNGELVYDTWICPSCGESYEIEYDRYDYCPVCGQAIDWSEE